MKKFILKLDLHDDKDKRKALKTASTLAGIDAISMDMKGKKLTVVGTVDPIIVVSKLRKFWPTEMILVGPAKEPEKKEEKKEEPKKEEGKKEEGKKEEPKKDEQKKEEPKKEDAKKPEAVIGIMPNRPYYPYMNGMPYPPANAIMPYRPYYPPPSTYYYANHSVEENPNGCIIC